MTTTSNPVRTLDIRGGLSAQLAEMRRKNPGPELLPGPLRCARCGARVTDPLAQAEEVRLIEGREVRAGGGVIVHNFMAQVQFGICDSCRARRRRAEALYNEHEPFLKRLGKRDEAVDYIDAALSVLDVAGLTVPQQDELLASKKVIGLTLTGTLGVPQTGMRFRWVRRVAPTLTLEAQRDGERARPWEHLGGEDRDDARTLLAHVLRRRVDQPRPVPPPPVVADNDRQVPVEGACLVCGVGEAVAAHSDAAREVWGRQYSATTAVLAKRPVRHATVVGHLCPSCRRGVEKSGDALGLRAVEYALAEHLGVTAAKLQNFMLNTARGGSIVGLNASAFAAAARDLGKPAKAPFEWIAWLDEAREELVQ